MKVKMLSRMANAARSAQPGDLVNVSEEEGQRLIAGGFAVAAPAKPRVDVDETTNDEWIDE